MTSEQFWSNKRVLVTGHTGFKGSWLCLWLRKMNANVVGLALEPTNSPALFVRAGVGLQMTSIIGDVRDRGKVESIFREYQPEIVIHLAAQSLVRHSYAHPHETFETNVMGTLNVLEAIRSTATVRAAVIVTTDKCWYSRPVWATCCPL
ncbi:MAG: NAD-dependent epimerase/dehydratase family protein [Halieaceae bacterium]|nr:NAD-dependent epimerase/dehydratase family protein [Halieaceae bacterium]